MSDPTNRMSADEAIKAIHDLQAVQSDLKERGDSLAQNLETKVEDLKASMKAIKQATAEAALANSHAGGKDNEFRRFIRDDGTLRVKGENTREAGWEEGLLDPQQPINAWHQRMLQLVEQKSLVTAITRKPATQTNEAIRRHMARAPGVVNKIFSDGVAGGGAEWVPDQMLPEIERALESALMVEALFSVRRMSNKNELLPFLSLGGRPYIKNAPSADNPGQYTSSTVTTAQRTIDAVALATRYQVDEDSSEDTIVASLPVLQDQIVRDLRDASEDTLLNGDTAGVHQDAIATWDIRGRWGTVPPLGGSNDHRRAWMGLRARSYDVASTFDLNAAQSYAGILTMLGQMDAPNGTAGERVIITSPEWYLTQMLGFAEVRTLDVMGPQATVLTGQLAAIAGLPVVVSDYMGADLAATGLYTGAGALTGALFVNRGRFQMGVYREAGVQMSTDITRGVIDLVSTRRCVFYSLDGAAKKNVSYAFNLSTT